LGGSPVENCLLKILKKELNLPFPGVANRGVAVMLKNKCNWPSTENLSNVLGKRPEFISAEALANRETDGCEKK
jgi:hypothetical protein